MARKAKRPMQVDDPAEQVVLAQYRQLRDVVVEADDAAQMVFTTVVSLRVAADGKFYTHYDSTARSARASHASGPEEESALLDMLAGHLRETADETERDRDALRRRHGVDPAHGMSCAGDLNEHEAHALLEQMDAVRQRQVDALRAETPDLSEGEAATILLATAPAGRTT